jgi:hypothetical protein
MRTRFARTTGEAFKDAEYACPITRFAPRTHRNDKIVIAACLVASIALTLLLALGL